MYIPSAAGSGQKWVRKVLGGVGKTSLGLKIHPV
jgi:hypothetical protein